MSTPPPPSRRWSLFPKALGREIEQLVTPIYHQHGFTEHRILTQWPQVVGKELAAGSAPRKLTFPKGKREQGVLQVVVNSGARALELQHMQPVILERIAAYFGYRAIEKVTFIQDSSLPTPSPKRRRRVVATEEKDAYTALTDSCADDELKAALSRLGSAIAEQ